MTATAADLVTILRRHQLLEPAQLDQTEKQLAGQFPEPKALARELVKRAWLSVYQMNQIGQGKAAELRLGPYLVLERLGILSGTSDLRPVPAGLNALLEIPLSIESRLLRYPSFRFPCGLSLVCLAEKK